jgi:hypothetical protein
MVKKITNNEYIKILEFYKIPIPGTKKLIQKEAENILSQKLCRCIKQIDSAEPRSIGICTKSIFNKKGFTRGKFRCKNKRFVTFRKTLATKTRKNNK